MRERKAQRSRERMISEAMGLFAGKGYEETTMEAIAEAADVSPSTLYRYFPSKDLIVLASFTGNTAKFAEVFALRVKDLSVERALAEAIFAVLAVEDEEPRHALLVRSILGQSPVARARLWDYLGEQQRQLSKQLAESLQKAGDDPIVLLTARVALEVLLAAADIWRASKGRTSSRATAGALMQLLRGGNVLFPDPGPESSTQEAAPKATARKALTRKQ
ncbi:TetR/AcrR family transcriptional regulator [Granulicella arctica]|uniref:TetR/AcrR family transcriptional regulator n=1 Tax=Granulicella arctica TaxID=940613 RepID=UPI0021E00DE6|nr:TetR/AcrR family transcriptional regulator [Granulicella arctica]